MVVSFSVKTEGSAIPRGGFEQALSMKKFVKKVNREVTPVIERRINAVMGRVPRPRDESKFVWSLNRAANERARRWWFNALRRGVIPTDGKHYRRSGAIPNAWNLFVIFRGGTFVLIFENPAPGSQYVYGSETQIQVPGHRQTGWPNARAYLIDFAEIIEKDIAAAWDEFVIKALR